MFLPNEIVVSHFYGIGKCMKVYPYNDKNLFCFSFDKASDVYIYVQEMYIEKSCIRPLSSKRTIYTVFQILRSKLKQKVDICDDFVYQGTIVDVAYILRKMHQNIFSKTKYKYTHQKCLKIICDEVSHIYKVSYESALKSVLLNLSHKNTKINDDVENK